MAIKRSLIFLKKDLSETEHIQEFLEILKNKINDYIKRIKDFNSFVFEEKTKLDMESVNISNYIRFILKNGSMEEKRELLTCFKSKIILKDKKIELENLDILTQ